MGRWSVSRNAPAFADHYYPWTVILCGGSTMHFVDGATFETWEEALAHANLASATTKDDIRDWLDGEHPGGCKCDPCLGFDGTERITPAQWLALNNRPLTVSGRNGEES